VPWRVGRCRGAPSQHTWRDLPDHASM